MKVFKHLKSEKKVGLKNARGTYNINSQIKFKTTTLKVLRNRILRTILVRLLICLIRLYVGRHFL